MKARGKERRRIKRLQKRKQARRLNSISPYRRLATHGRIHECLISADWQKTGLITTFTSVTGPTGLAAAGFLIDTWCCGLKDAWGYLNVLPEDVERTKERMAKDMQVVDTDIDEIRRWVAGGIRFADQNGFRLPHRYDRWTSIIGGVGDWKTADLTGFAFQGGLYYVGTMQDLRSRLIACSAEEFLRRPGVHFTMRVDDPRWLGPEEGQGLYIADDEDDDESVLDEPEDGLEEDQEDDADEEMEEDAHDATPPGQPGNDSDMEHLRADLRGVKRDLLIAGIVRDARCWCMENLMLPHPRLKDAAVALAESILDTSDEGKEGVVVRLMRIFPAETPQSMVVLTEAVFQLRTYTRQFASVYDLFHSALAAANPASGPE